MPSNRNIASWAALRPRAIARMTAQVLEVVEFMAVKRYSHIMHICSTVVGRLRAEMCESLGPSQGRPLPSAPGFPDR